MLSGGINLFNFTDAEGNPYFVHIIETTGALTPLPDAACAAVGVANGCLGFVTAENAVTDAQFAFFITTSPIAEPGSLALFGAVLLGLAMVRRRRS